MSKIILDLCGYKGAFSQFYKKAGYQVYIIDNFIAKGELDVRLYSPQTLGISEVYGILASPPCTHLAGSGARWWAEKGTKALLEALSIVDACLRIIWLYKPKFWVLENPVGRLTRYLGKPKMYFHPCDFGDPWTKKTCLWGNFNIPEKNSVEPCKNIPKGSHCQDITYSRLLKQGKNPIHYMPPSKDRSQLRSIIPAGFAQVFFKANQ